MFANRIIWKKSQSLHSQKLRYHGEHNKSTSRKKKIITINVINKFCMQARSILTNLSPNQSPTPPKKLAQTYNSAPCQKFHSKSFTCITTQIYFRLNKNAQLWIGKKVPSLTFNTKRMSKRTTVDAVTYTENFMGGVSISGVWWSFVFCILCLWCHNLTSYSCFQTNVLAKFFDMICIFFYTHSS